MAALFFFPLICIFAFINLWMAFSIFRYLAAVLYISSVGSIQLGLDHLFIFLMNSIVLIFLVSRHFKLSFKKLGNASLSTSIASILNFYCFIFILIGLLLVVREPWFMNQIFRSNYMESASIFLRFFKIMPLFILALLIYQINKSVGVKHSILKYLGFIIAFGSKSGVVFPLLHVITLIHGGIIKLNLKNYLRLFLMVFCATVIIFTLFFFIAQETNSDVILVFQQRLFSDVLGTKMSLDSTQLAQCIDYNILNPLLNFSGKIGLPVDAGGNHLSFGNCLVSPDNPEYLYEVLVPLSLELVYIYGLINGSLLFLILMAIHYLLWRFLILATNAAKYWALNKATGIYAAFSTLNIVLGGKFFNWFVSEYITIVFILMLIIVFDSVLPKRGLEEKL